MKNMVTWVMDTVTWSKRDMDGSKYMVVQSPSSRPIELASGVWIARNGTTVRRRVALQSVLVA